MTSLPGFTVDIDHNPYLPAGGRDVSAVVTVTAEASDDTPPEPGAAGASAEIIIVDRSISMGSPRSKIVQARAATAAAVDVIRDGTWFAIIAGAGAAQLVYPAKGSMALADERTRKEARQAALKVRLRGGTAMSTWLRRAYQTFESCPATLRHAILLTDGENLEPPKKLAAAIALCEGAFRVNAAAAGQEMLAARVSLVASSADGQQVLGQGLIKAEGTHDEELSTRINHRVAHYTGQQELADAIQEGLEASKRGDGETATAKLGRAVALAHQAGNEDTARLLAKVVDVVDEATGTVRLKKKVEAADEMALDTRSTKTVRVKP
jgi:hypothetical protein